MPGFSRELLPGVAGILSIPALLGLAGRFARRLAPSTAGACGMARGLRAESRRGRVAVLRSLYGVAREAGVPRGGAAVRHLLPGP